ncbi:MAG: alpha/beta hydrolase [Betaproteobacteria bacterium]|nr:alpha/beta hydrolase [Betaproteobacteria bacterium]
MEAQVQNKSAYAYTGGKPFDAKLPTVMFIHGGECDHSVWTLPARYFAHHGFGVLAVDLPGHGRTDGSPLFSIEDMSDWIVMLLDAIGVAKAALVGHSMGSLIALDTAGRRHDRVAKIALLGTTFPMRVSSELLGAAQEDESRAQNMINAWSHSAYAYYPNNPGPGAWLHGANLRLMQRQKPGVLFADFNACNAYNAGTDRAKDTTCPALFILGKRDAMTPVRGGREFAKAIKHAQVVELADAGHNLMGERPDEVLDSLRGFL